MAYSKNFLALATASVLVASPVWAQNLTPPLGSPSTNLPVGLPSTSGTTATGGIPGTLGAIPYAVGGSPTGAIPGTLGGTPLAPGGSATGSSTTLTPVSPAFGTVTPGLGGLGAAPAR